MVDQPPPIAEPQAGQAYQVDSLQPETLPRRVVRLGLTGVAYGWLVFFALATVLPLVWMIAPRADALTVMLPEVPTVASLLMPLVPAASSRMSDEDAAEVAPPMTLPPPGVLMSTPLPLRVPFS